jgi:hypothetical protein
VLRRPVEPALEVDHQLELGRSHGRQANGLFAFENAAGVSARDAEKIVV